MVPRRTRHPFMSREVGKAPGKLSRFPAETRQISHEPLRLTFCSPRDSLFLPGAIAGYPNRLVPQYCDRTPFFLEPCEYLELSCRPDVSFKDKAADLGCLWQIFHCFQLSKERTRVIFLYG